MVDSSTEVSSASPKPQTIIDSLEKDERNCVFVALEHVRVLLFYISIQTALALKTFYI